MNIEIERKKLELKRVELSRYEMQFKILQRLEDITRLEKDIIIQSKKIKEIEIILNKEV